jgi:hypothetical protein
MSFLKKTKSPKAIKSKKLLEKGLALFGESIGLGKPFFASFTFKEKEGVWGICPCCGGESLEKDILELVK